MYIALGLLGLLLLATAVAGSLFCNRVIFPKTLSPAEGYAAETRSGKMDADAFDRLNKESFQIQSPFGYTLSGLYFPCPGSKKAVILCHGITCTWHSSVKYMNLFQKRDFNILIYDQRNHGSSGGHNTTLGFYEKHDLKACSDWLFHRLGQDACIGIHGESMGAAVALQNAALDERIAFYIADCSCSDLWTLLAYRLKYDYKLPPFPMLYVASLFSKIKTGAFFSQISPIRDMADIRTPIFFIHGQQDRYIPPQMSVDMYHRKKIAKKLYLAPNARHSDAYWSDKAAYDRQIGDFLEEIGL